MLKMKEVKEGIPTFDGILRGSSHALTVFKPGAAGKLPLFIRLGGLTGVDA